MTILVTLSILALAQANGMEETADAMLKLLNYCATHTDTAVR